MALGFATTTAAACTRYAGLSPAAALEAAARHRGEGGEWLDRRRQWDCAGLGEEGREQPAGGAARHREQSHHKSCMACDVVLINMLGLLAAAGVAVGGIENYAERADRRKTLVLANSLWYCGSTLSRCSKGMLLEPEGISFDAPMSLDS
eukprot:jgi/Chlat1/1521/Chrsp121S01799